VVVPYYVEMAAKKKDNAGSKLAGLFQNNTDSVQTDEVYEQRKRDLIQRTNLVAQGLAQLGVRAAVLGTQEVIELFYTAYNQEEAISQNLTEVNEMTTPVVERGNPNPEPYTPQVPMNEPIANTPHNPLENPGGQV
jgi:hypothetical protein